MNPGQTTQDSNRPTVATGQVDVPVEKSQFTPNGIPNLTDPTSTKLSPVEEGTLSRVGATAVVKSQNQLDDAHVESNNAVTDGAEKQANIIQFPAPETTPNQPELTQPQEDSALAAPESRIVYTGKTLGKETVLEVRKIIYGLERNDNTAEEYNRFVAERDRFSEAVRKGTVSVRKGTA